MNRFWTVYEFELLSYIKNKSFMITTVLMAFLLCAATFLPRVIDMSDMLGLEPETTVEEVTEDKQQTKLGIVDKNGYFAEESILKQAFPDAEFLYMESQDELKKGVMEEEVEAGFYVVNDTKYQYYVLNRDISDTNQMIFDELMSVVHKQVYCSQNGMDYETFMTEYEMPIECEEEILGKDAEDSFWYCYALVFVIYMVIIIYGVMIATSVTTEKSNRSIEVLVTSVDAKYLLFGKVFAGVTAVVVQIGLILGAVLAGYAVNHDAWGNKLDMLLDIPPAVLGTFAVFGVGGFIFYAFLYGAMGALVSKTEDINKSAGSIQMVIIIVFCAVIFQLQNPDGMIMKVCSFLPFSSYSAMFVRIGMGKVEMWEVIVSAIILCVSTFFVGWLAAKIYRMGTLRYGNPIKFGKALKDMKNAE